MQKPPLLKIHPLCVREPTTAHLPLVAGMSIGGGTVKTAPGTAPGISAPRKMGAVRAGGVRRRTRYLHTASRPMRDPVGAAGEPYRH